MTERPLRRQARGNPDRSLLSRCRQAVRVGAILTAIAVASACSPAGPSTPSATGLPTASPSASGPASSEISEAIAVRTRFGLRADESWVRHVAGDPAARVGIPGFGIPLTPSELADLQSRRWDEDLLVHVQSYCRSVPDDCAGAYINLHASGVAVDLAREVDKHRLALRSMVTDPSLIDVREVEWSRSDLDRFRQRVEADRQWFESVGLRYLQVDRRITDNFLHVDFIGPTRESEQAVEAHFGSPTWLQAEWYPQPWDGPNGDLVIEIRDQAGKPVAGTRCELTPEDDVVRALMTDDWFHSDKNGVCEITDTPAVSYQVSLRRFDSQTGWATRPAKEFTVVVRPEGTRVDITLPTSP
jgi:hypothetical protein